MALVYRGLSGSQPVYWLEGSATPAGVTNVVLASETNVTNSSTGSSPGSRFGSSMPSYHGITRIKVAEYVFGSYQEETPKEIGAFYFDPSEHSETSAELRVILSATNENHKAGVRLWNAKTKKYVELTDGKFDLSTTNIEPTVLISDNLFSNKEFVDNEPRVYVLHLFGGKDFDGVIHYSTEFITK